MRMYTQVAPLVRPTASAFTTTLTRSPDPEGGQQADRVLGTLHPDAVPGSVPVRDGLHFLPAWDPEEEAVARVRDLAKSLVALARDAATFDGQRVHRDKAKDSLALHEFAEQLNTYASLLAEKMTRDAEAQGDDPGMRIAALADRVGALIRVLEAGQAATLGALSEDIRTLFQGDPERSVVLSTVHRAKGLEADRVFLLEPGLLPHPKAVTPRAVQAERCLQFVAYTRAKRDLFFVDAEVSCIPDEWRGRE